MSYLEDTTKLKMTDVVHIKCDICKQESFIGYKAAKLSFIKCNGFHFCRSCAAKKRKNKICTKEYWSDPVIKKKHSQSMKSSEAYYDSLKSRDTSGQNNGMFGKSHTTQTKQKMSKARKGKTGENATAWQGGKTSVNKCVKKYINKELKWSFRVFTRDNWKCVNCSSNKKLDAHHILPLNPIIKRLLKNTAFTTIREKVEWLVEQPDIRDDELKNGITLCRVCHREIHKNWGSHEPKV